MEAPEPASMAAQPFAAVKFPEVFEIKTAIFPLKKTTFSGCLSNNPCGRINWPSVYG
jgi:hypothetical protein